MLDSSLEKELDQLLGKRLRTSSSEIEAHSHDEAYTPPAPPDAVAYPESTAEVVDIVRLCAASRCPIVPFGAGTSLEGHVVPTRGGLSMDMTRMNKILTVHEEDLDGVVQPGVTRLQLETHLRDTGLFFTVDPGADATLGGMAATRASGTTAVRYGTMRENVLAMEAVLADGRTIRVGSRARKSSSGYDLRSLLLGSEGTLGIITELTLRLHGQPAETASGVCVFKTIKSAVQAVILAIQYGIPMVRIELLNALQMRGMNIYSGLDYPELPTLFVEFRGSRSEVEEHSRAFGEIAAEQEGEFEWATAAKERNRLWKARHNALYSARALRSGAGGYITDVCVPISRLADCIEETEEDLKSSALLAPLVGHVGDGNFHLTILTLSNKPEEIEEATRIASRLATRALEMGGTITGEHGVGSGKMKHMLAEHGAAWEVMAEIKKALDPLGILNPGKVVPPSQEIPSLSVT